MVQEFGGLGSQKGSYLCDVVGVAGFGDILDVWSEGESRVKGNTKAAGMRGGKDGH